MSPSGTSAEPSSANTILNTPMMIMGPTKSGKSSLLVTFAEYVWETFHQITLYYLADGGGFPVQAQALINRGIMRLFRMRTRSGKGLAFETCQRASQGYWPARINPTTGEVDPNVRMVAPVTTLFAMYCPNGHLIKTVPYQSLLGTTLCPTCKEMTTKQNMKVESTSRRTKGFEQVGAVAYDGISSMCSWMMDDLGERAGRNELGGEKGNLGTIVSGDMAFGSTNRASYGGVQTRAESMVLASSAIPGLAIPPVWTALTQEGSDEGTLTVVGPLLAGTAKTAVAGQWFGDTLETEVVELPTKERFRKLHLQTWMDERGRRHLCGVRSYPNLMPNELEEKEGDDAPFSKFSIAEVYRLREAARLKTEASYDQRYADAPGLPTGEVEYGEPAQVVSAETTGASAATPSGAASSVKAPAPAGSAPVSRPSASPVAKPAVVKPAVAVAKPAAQPVKPVPKAPAAPASTKPAAVSPQPAVEPATALPTQDGAAPGAPTSVGTAAAPQAPIPSAPKPPVKGAAPPPGRRPTS